MNSAQNFVHFCCATVATHDHFVSRIDSRSSEKCMALPQFLIESCACLVPKSRSCGVEVAQKFASTTPEFVADFLRCRHATRVHPPSVLLETRTMSLQVLLESASCLAPKKVRVRRRDRAILRQKIREFVAEFCAFLRFSINAPLSTSRMIWCIFTQYVAPNLRSLVPFRAFSCLFKG